MGTGGSKRLVGSVLVPDPGWVVVVVDVDVVELDDVVVVAPGGPPSCPGR